MCDKPCEYLHLADTVEFFNILNRVKAHLGNCFSFGFQPFCTFPKSNYIVKKKFSKTCKLFTKKRKKGMLNTESKQIKSLWVLYCKTCEIMKNQWTYERWDSRNVGRASRSVRFKRQASILVRVWFIERIRKRLAKLAACLSAWLLPSFLGLSVDGVIIPYWLVGCFAGQ